MERETEPEDRPRGLQVSDPECGPLNPPPSVVATVAPAAAKAFVRAQTLIGDVADPVLAELVRLRLAKLLGDTRGLERRSVEAVARGLTEDKIRDLPSWASSEHYSAVEKACLALAEQYAIDVSAVSAEETGAVLEHLGPAGLLGFVQALFVIDQSIRIDLALTGVREHVIAKGVGVE